VPAIHSELEPSSNLGCLVRYPHYLTPLTPVKPASNSRITPAPSVCFSTTGRSDPLSLPKSPQTRKFRPKTPPFRRNSCKFGQFLATSYRFCPIPPPPLVRLLACCLAGEILLSGWPGSFGTAQPSEPDSLTTSSLPTSSQILSILSPLSKKPSLPRGLRRVAGILPALKPLVAEGDTSPYASPLPLSR